MSNYPPGVTGFEYAIGGAEREWKAIAECPNCEWVGWMPHEFHHEFGTRAWCMNPENPPCVNKREGFEVLPDEPDYDDD